MKSLTKQEERVASALGVAIMVALAGYIGFGGWGLCIGAAAGAVIGYTEETE